VALFNTVYHLNYINPLSRELNPICYLLALLAHDFQHVSRIRVNVNGEMREGDKGTKGIKEK
jgi:transposase